MSVGERCESCHQGELRPFLLSATEAIVKCNNFDCDGYLDFLPKETLIEPASGVVYNSGGVSGRSSRCSGRSLKFSPPSPAHSQDSSTDKEVAQISGLHSPVVPSYNRTPLYAPPPQAPLPPPQWDTILYYNPANINDPSLDEVDRFLDSIVDDTLQVAPPQNKLLSSHRSAFSQVTPFGTTNFPVNAMRSQNYLELAAGDNTASKGNNLCVDSAMLDDNLFQSPAGSVVSEDSGYNDEISSAVAVSEAGTRGSHATTKTTSSNVVSSAMHLNLSKSADPMSVSTIHNTSLLPVISTPIASTSTTMSCSTAVVTALASASSHSRMNNPLNPEEGLTSKLLLPTLHSGSAINVASTRHVNSPFLSNLEPSHDSLITINSTIHKYPKLKLTELFSIFEQNLSLCIVNEIKKASSPSPKQETTKPVSLDSNLISTPLIGEANIPSNERLLIDSSSGDVPSQPEVGEVSETVLPKPTAKTVGVSGRPPKRKYKKQKHADDQHSSTDPTQTEDVDNKLGTDTTTTTSRYQKKRKKDPQAPPVAARKSVRKLTSEVKMTKATEVRPELAFPVNLRPSLAALLPPITSQPHHKSSCSGGRSSKRHKPAHPYRHLASNANADPWAFPGILLDQLNIEVVLQGRPRRIACKSDQTPEVVVPHHVHDHSNDSQSNKQENHVASCSVLPSTQDTGAAAPTTTQPPNTNLIALPLALDTASETSSKSVLVTSSSCSDTLVHSSRLLSSGSIGSVVTLTSGANVCSSKLPSRSARGSSSTVGVVRPSAPTLLATGGATAGYSYSRGGSSAQPVLAVAPFDRPSKRAPLRGNVSIQEYNKKNPEDVCQNSQKHISHNPSLKGLETLVNNQKPPIEGTMKLLGNDSQKYSNIMSPKVSQLPIELSNTQQVKVLNVPQYLHNPAEMLQRCKTPLGQTIPHDYTLNQRIPSQQVVVLPRGQICQVVKQQEIVLRDGFVQVPPSRLVGADQVSAICQQPTMSVPLATADMSGNYTPMFIQQQAPSTLVQTIGSLHAPSTLVQTTGALHQQPHGGNLLYQVGGWPLQQIQLQQHQQIPPQPAVFRQAGPHSQPRATLSSVLPTTDITDSNDLMTPSVHEVGVGQHSANSSSSHNTQESPAPCSPTQCLDTHKRVKSEHFHTCAHVSAFVPSPFVPSVPSEFDIPHEDSEPTACSLTKTASKTPVSVHCSFENLSVSQYSDGGCSVNNLSSSLRATNSVSCSSTADIVSNPPSPDSYPTSPQNFPSLGLSPESLPEQMTDGLLSHSPLLDYSRELSSSPNTFPFDKSPMNRFSSMEASLSLPVPLSSPSSPLELHLSLSEDEATAHCSGGIETSPVTLSLDDGNVESIMDGSVTCSMSSSQPYDLQDNTSQSNIVIKSTSQIVGYSFDNTPPKFVWSRLPTSVKLSSLSNQSSDILTFPESQGRSSNEQATPVCENVIHCDQNMNEHNPKLKRMINILHDGKTINVSPMQLDNNYVITKTADNASTYCDSVEIMNPTCIASDGLNRCIQSGSNSAKSSSNFILNPLQQCKTVDSVVGPILSSNITQLSVSELLDADLISQNDDCLSSENVIVVQSDADFNELLLNKDCNFIPASALLIDESTISLTTPDEKEGCTFDFGSLTNEQSIDDSLSAFAKSVSPLEFANKKKILPKVYMRKKCLENVKLHCGSNIPMSHSREEKMLSKLAITPEHRNTSSLTTPRPSSSKGVCLESPRVPTDATTTADRSPLVTRVCSSIGMIERPSFSSENVNSSRLQGLAPAVIDIPTTLGVTHITTKSINTTKNSLGLFEASLPEKLPRKKFKYFPSTSIVKENSKVDKHPRIDLSSANINVRPVTRKIPWLGRLKGLESGVNYNIKNKENSGKLKIINIGGTKLVISSNTFSTSRSTDVQQGNSFDIGADINENNSSLYKNEIGNNHSEIDNDASTDSNEPLELPDDDDAYQQIINCGAYGDNLEKPQIKLPVKMNASITAQYAIEVKRANRVVRIVGNSVTKLGKTVFSSKVLSRKVVAAKKLLKKAKVGSNFAHKRNAGPTAVDVRAVAAQETIDDIVSTRKVADIPEMVIVNVSGKLFMFGDS